MRRNTPALVQLPLAVLLLMLGHNCFGIGEPEFVETTPRSGSFSICDKGSIATIEFDTNDFAGVIRAAGDLQKDIASVTGKTPKIVSEKTPASSVILIGTVGKSEIIDQ